MQANAVVLQHLKLHYMPNLKTTVDNIRQNWMGTATSLSFIRIGSYFINLNFFCSVFHEWKTINVQSKSLDIFALLTIANFLLFIIYLAPFRGILHSIGKKIERWMKKNIQRVNSFHIRIYDGCFIKWVFIYI